MKNLNLSNNKNLTFTTLFFAKNKLLDIKLFKRLDIREQLALKFIENIVTNKKSISIKESPANFDVTSFKNMLKWILETNVCEYSEDKSYDEVIDMASILLAKEYKDESSLPIIADLIFKRYSKNLLIHDLVWGFFGANNLSTLYLAAEKLKSNNRVEVELACKLLNIQLYDDLSQINQDDLYKSFLGWLEKNKNYIYFTGESYQQKTNPIIYTINHEAKYLCKQVKANNGEFLDPLSDYENQLLHNFNLLDFNTKLLLENYSSDHYTKNYLSWKDWISCPIAHQIQIALLGGYHDLYL